MSPVWERRAGALLLPIALAAALALPAGAGARVQPVRAGPAGAPTHAARSATAPPAGLVPASALLLYEEDTGEVVYQQNAGAELAIASTTKLMTAYVTLHHERPSALLTEQPYDAGPGESLAGVPAGTRLTSADMLRAMLLPSGNDVANSLAIDVGGSVPRFVEEMNAAARALKLGRTRYTTPVGLDQPPGNYSTALDLARLTAVLMRNPLFASIVRQRSARLGDGLVLANLNDLLAGHPWVVGVKTGTTLDAGYCMVGAATLHGVRVISVVLGTTSRADRDADTLALLRYGLARFRRARIARAGQRFGALAVAGRARRVPIVAQRSASLVVPVTAHLHAALELPRRLTGPLPVGAFAGSILVRSGGRVVATVALVTVARVPAPAPLRRRDDPLVWMAAGCGAGALLLGCSLPVMRRRGNALEAP